MQKIKNSGILGGQMARVKAEQSLEQEEKGIKSCKRLL